MALTKPTRRRGAAVVVSLTGLLAVLGSVPDWGSCPTTPCGGRLQAISEYSGFDLGFGFVTAFAGLGLFSIGLIGIRRGDGRFGQAAVLHSLLIVATVGVTLIWMYVFPGDDTDFYWPPYGAILVGIVGLVALAASLRLRRSMPQRE